MVPGGTFSGRRTGTVKEDGPAILPAPLLNVYYPRVARVGGDTG